MTGMARQLAEASLDLVICRGEIGERHRDCDDFLVQVLEGDLELLAGPKSGQQLGRDRHVGVAAAVLAGLDRKIDRLAVVDLELRACRQVEAERQLYQRNWRARV